MKKKTITITVILIIGAAITFVLTKNKKELNEKANIKEVEFAIPVQVSSVIEKTLNDGLIATGEFKGWEEVTLVAESQGAINKLYFKEGDVIKKGNVVANIDAVSLNSQLSSAKSRLAKAKKDVERYEKLEKAGAVSQTQLENTKIEMENASANIAQLQQQLGFTSVKSPINGVVNELMVEESGFVMPGNKIAEIVLIDRLKIIVKVSEDNLSKIKEGQTVTLKTDVYPLEKFSGKVSNISVKADESRKFKITIEVKNTENLTLRAGMFAEVFFDSLESNQITALTVPRKAIVNSLQNPSVYIIINNVATLKKIEVGTSSNGSVVVLAGLAKGDKVVTKGIINLKEGTKVTINK